MPELDTTGLWEVQVRAITTLEKSRPDNKPRAIVQMATGSGKVFIVLAIFFGQAIQALATQELKSMASDQGR